MDIRPSTVPETRGGRFPYSAGGDLIRRERLAHHLPTSTVAERLGMDVAVLRGLERGALALTDPEWRALIAAVRLVVCRCR